MDMLRTGVLVLFVLPVPASCDEVFFTEPTTCYILDGILIIYCIIATAFYFREKFSFISPVAAGVVDKQEIEDNGGDYQELERPQNTDPYQVLEPSKRKRKAGKKSQPRQAEERNRDPYESLIPSTSAPPLSPR